MVASKISKYKIGNSYKLSNAIHGFTLLVGSWVTRANLQTSKAVKRFFCVLRFDFTCGNQACTIIIGNRSLIWKQLGINCSCERIRPFSNFHEWLLTSAINP